MEAGTPWTHARNLLRIAELPKNGPDSLIRQRPSVVGDEESIAPRVCREATAGLGIRPQRGHGGRMNRYEPTLAELGLTNREQGMAEVDIG